MKNKKTGHTPGPWKVKWAGKLVNMYGWCVYPDSIKSYLLPIAWAFPCDMEDDGKKTEEANARLIAAAPELLAALESLLSAAEEDGGDLDGPIEQAKAAIAKAKGEK